MLKKEKIKALMKLNHLVNINGDPEEIARLRAMLSQDGTDEKGSKEIKPVKRIGISEEQYFRLKALQFTEAEIAFALMVSSATINELKKSLDSRTLKEGIEKYEQHRIIENFNKSRKKRWRHL